MCVCEREGKRESEGGERELPRQGETDGTSMTGRETTKAISIFSK